MQISDVIADMLTRIRNVNNAKHETVDVPASNVKKAIADILLNRICLNTKMRGRIGNYLWKLIPNIIHRSINVIKCNRPNIIHLLGSSICQFTLDGITRKKFYHTQFFDFFGLAIHTYHGYIYRLTTKV